MEHVAVLVEPRLQGSGVVPTRIVCNDRDGATLAAMPNKLIQEGLEGLSVKPSLLTSDQASIADAQRTEYAYTLARRRV